MLGGKSQRETAANVWDGIKNTVSTKLNNIKNSYQEHGGGIKGAVAGTMTAIKEYYKTGYDAINSLLQAENSDRLSRV